jgi:putative transposase
VADLTYVKTMSASSTSPSSSTASAASSWAGRSLRAELALDALEMAIHSRRAHELGGLTHHSDRGGLLRSIRYTERLGEVGVVNSVGSRGDSYDNALAESFIGLYKAELVFHKGPWKGVEDVGWARLTCVE